MEKAISAVRLFENGRMNDFHAVEETLKIAVLSNDPERRARAIRDLNEKSRGHITRGFGLGGKLYLEVNVNGDKRLFYFCDMPHEYEGATRPGAHCFELTKGNEPILAGCKEI